MDGRVGEGGANNVVVHGYQLSFFKKRKARAWSSVAPEALVAMTPTAVVMDDGEKTTLSLPRTRNLPARRVAKSDYWPLIKFLRPHDWM